MGLRYMLGVALSALSFGQGNVLSVAPPARATAKAGGTFSAAIHVELRAGYHVNSSTPSDEYLIPLRLTWSAASLEVAEIVYPKPKMEKFSFSSRPLSVYTGDFAIVSRFRAPASAPPGPATVAGKLRYQACNDRMCLPPKTVDVVLPVDIVR